MSDESLPTGWTSATLEEVAEINPRSFTVVPSALGLPVHFVPMSSVREDFGGVDVSQRRMLSEVVKGYTAFTSGDVLFAKITPCMENGKGGVVPVLKDQVGFGSTEFHVLRSCGAVTPDWLGRYLSQISFREEARNNMTGSAGQMRVPTVWLKAKSIPVPPVREQQRIVSKLDGLLSDLQNGVTELKAAQSKLQHYRQSLLKAAVQGDLTADWRAANPPTETGAELLHRILAERQARWVVTQRAKAEASGRPLAKDWRGSFRADPQPAGISLPTLPKTWVWASVAQAAKDEKHALAIGPFGSNLTVPDYRSSGVPLVFVRNIRAGKYGGSYTNYIDAEKARELSAHAVVSGDVLVTKMGDPPGDADIYPSNQPPGVITADCIKITCDSDLVLPGFLVHVINSPFGRAQMRPLTQGVAQKKVSLGRFETFPIPLPPLAEQAQIVSLLDECSATSNSLRDALEWSLAQCSAQRQNILRAAFAGQLVPQDPTDEPADVLLARIRAQRAAVVPAGRLRRASGRPSRSVA